VDEHTGSTRTGVCVWVCVLNTRNAGQENPVIADLR